MSAGVSRPVQVRAARQQTCETRWTHAGLLETFWLSLCVCEWLPVLGGALAGSGGTGPGCRCVQEHGADAQTDHTCWDQFCRGTSGLHPGVRGLPWTWVLEAVCTLSCLGTLAGLPGSLETFPKHCGLCTASPWCQPMGFMLLPRSVLAGEVCWWAPEQGLVIALLIWESDLILHKELYQSLSVLSAQTPSRSTLLNIYCTQGIMHLFKGIINAFKCVRLYQNAQQSLPVRPRVTSLTKMLLLAY